MYYNRARGCCCCFLAGLSLWCGVLFDVVTLHLPCIPSQGGFRNLRLFPSHLKSSGISCMPKHWIWMCWKAPHLAIICQGVSSSSLQCLHEGSGLLKGSVICLCLFRKQWPVIHLMALPKVSLGHFMICFEKVGFGSWRNSLVCLHLSVLFHLFVQWKWISSFIFLLKNVVGRGSQGSTPGGGGG